MNARLATLLLLFAAPALAQGELAAPEVTRSRGLLAISARGTVKASGPLVARVRRGDRTALEVPVTPDASGAFAVDLLTPKLLLADRYVLEVGAPGGAALVSRELQVGTDEEVKAARARVGAWYRGAYSTLRDLSANLEQRGAFHRALAEQDPDLHQARFEAALDAWWAGLRAARMDLATWQRRLLLPWKPEVGAALGREIDVLAKRADRWRAVVKAQGTIEAPDLLTAMELIATLELSSGWHGGETVLDTWRGGDLGTPPAGAPAGTAALDGVRFEGGFGRLVDPVGFAFDVPEGATALPADQKPSERLLLDAPGGARLVVQVQDLPDATDEAAVRAAVETGAWEQYLSYKRLSTTGVESGVRIEFRAQVEQTGQTVHVVQVSRRAKRPGRVLHLLIVRPPEQAPPAWLERVASSFGGAP